MINKNDIKHIAGLARIGLNESEIIKYQRELSVILDYFKKLNEVDTEKVNFMSHITEINNVYRDDIVKDDSKNKKKRIIKNAPQVKDNQIKVRSVLK